MSEKSDIQDPVRDILIWHNFLVIRVNSGRRGGVWFCIWYAIGLAAQMAGVSDLIGIAPNGKFFAVEVKLPGKKRSLAQIGFQNEIEKRGGLVAVVDDARWEPPEEWMR